MAENFTCSAQNLSRNNATELAWTLQVGDGNRQSVIVVAVFQFIFLVVGIPSNILVIAAILKNKLLSQPTHLLLLNLAVSDLLVCVLVMPFNIVTALAGRFIIGSTDYVRCQFCQIFIITIIMMIFLSLFTVASMSVDRIIYIKYPLKYPKIVTFKRMIVVMLIAWTLCIFIGLPPVFGVGEIGYSKIVGTCSIILHSSTREAYSVYYICLLVCVAIFPFITTVVANVWLLFIMLRFLWTKYNKVMSNMKNFSSQSSLEHIQSVHNIESKYNMQQIFLAKVFGTIFVVNIVTWIPTVFIALASGIVGGDRIPPETFSFIFIMFLSQPAIHPILETFLVTKVRNSLSKCICCCRHERTQGEFV